MIQGAKIVYTFPESGLVITETVFLSLIVIVIATVICLFLTSDLKKVPTTKRQIIAEMLVGSVQNLVSKNMGDRFVKRYAPYIAALIAYSVLGSWLSLLGLRSITSDLNVTLSWGLMTFAMIHYHRFRTNGFIGYFKKFAEPIPVMLPINIISDAITPVSMAFRHFGNVLGGAVISSLVIQGLTAVNNMLGLPFPLLQIGTPAVLSLYFDLFSGALQAFVFAMLTMVFVSGEAS